MGSCRRAERGVAGDRERDGVGDGGELGSGVDGGWEKAGDRSGSRRGEAGAWDDREWKKVMAWGRRERGESGGEGESGPRAASSLERPDSSLSLSQEEDSSPSGSPVGSRGGSVPGGGRGGNSSGFRVNGGGVSGGLVGK